MDLIKLWKILRDENTRLSDLPFLARLQTAISRTVIAEEAKKQLEKLLACENANQECQRAIAPTPETRTIIDYLKACRNLGSENQEMQMLAETMAAAFRMGNEGYFTCGDKSHLKRDYAKKANKKLPRICHRCHCCIASKIVNLNLILRENLFRETPNRGPHQFPDDKNQGQILSFPSNPQHPAVLPSIYQP